MFHLDELQTRAVTSPAKTVVVRGGPGTGKTAVVERRFVHLLEENVPASSILVIVFSSAAAEAFRRKIGRQPGQEQGFCHTFHSFASTVANSPDWDWEEHGPPTPISPFKEYLLVKEILHLKRLEIRSSFRKVCEMDGFARQLSDFFKLLKQNLIFPQEFYDITEGLSSELSDLAHLYHGYQKLLNERNFAGFPDMVARAVELLRERPHVCCEASAKFRHVLIDEFEEIDPAQFELLKLIVVRESSLFAAGDEQQRIFGFRGSGSGRFALLKRFRGPVEEYLLSSDYRLPAEIGAAARRLIGHDAQAETPNLSVSGGVLEVTRHKDCVEQAYAVARDIKRIMLDDAGDGRTSYADFAILCRSASRSALPFQEALSYYEIPYVIHDATSFYAHPMIRFLADLMRHLHDPDDDAALERTLNIPAFGIDPVALRRCVNGLATAPNRSLREALSRSSTDSKTLSPSEENILRQIQSALDYLQRLRSEIHAGVSPAAVARAAMRDLFLREILGKDVGAGVHDARNLRLFDLLLADIEDSGEVRSEGSFAKVMEYLEHAFAYFSQCQETVSVEERAQGVRIMTIHQAKGLGFPYVFLVDMTDEYFPSLERNISLLDGQSSRLLSSALKKYFAKSSVSFPYFEFFTKLEERLEEERQLVYVALTRAGRRLSINYPEESHLGEPVEPSPFLDEFIGEGGQLNDIPPSSDGSGVVKQLENALSRDEIENLVHACLHASTAPDAVNEAVALLAPLGLDKKYLCARHPFEPESAAPPSIENHHFSASQLSTYLTCPRRFFYERLLRIAPERERELAVGQLIHLTLQTFHERHKIFDADHAALERELLLIFENVWKGEGGQQPAQGFEILFPTGLQRWAIKTRAVEILKRYLKTELAHAADTNVIACERFLEFQVRGRLFRARIDRIDAVRDLAGHKIIDYKTSRSGPMGAKTIKKLFLNLDDAPDYIPQDFQLPLYLLAGRAEGYHPVELAYYWVAQTNSAGMFKKSSLTVGVEEDCLTPEEMGAAEAAIVEVTSRILAGDFPAAPRSPFECQWCSFAGICER